MHFVKLRYVSDDQISFVWSVVAAANATASVLCLVVVVVVVVLRESSSLFEYL